MPDYLTGDSRVLQLYIDAAWVPVGCLTDNSFSEEVETRGTTTRNSNSWKTSLVTKQSYTISFTGIETDDSGVVSSLQLRALKKARALVTWRIYGALGGTDTGTGYITSISETSPAGDLSTFDGEIVGYGTP